MKRKGSKFRIGQVVFSTEYGEYIRVKKIGPMQDLGMTEVRCFNPRWGVDETHRAKNLRPLTRKEASRATK